MTCNPRQFSTRLRAIFAALFAIMIGISAFADEGKDAAPIASARTIHSLLAAGKFDEIYRDWCHPHLTGQLTAKEFVEMMNDEFGKGVTKLFADVIEALDQKAGPEVILAQSQEDKDKYEFVLTKVRQSVPTSGKRAPWHIELKLHQGKWKLMDTD